MDEPVEVSVGFAINGGPYLELGCSEFADMGHYRAEIGSLLRGIADEIETQERAEATANDPDAALAAIRRMWNGEGPAVNDDD